MIEQDFYKLHIGQEIWYKGEKKSIICIHAVFGENKSIAFYKDKNEIEGYKWQDIMYDCSLEEPFEVKEDCIHREPTGEPFCMKHEKFIAVHSSFSCFNCPDYEKKKKVVRFYGYFSVSMIGLSKEVVFKNYDKLSLGIKTDKEYGVKICPETNRIYIEVEE